MQDISWSDVPLLLACHRTRSLGRAAAHLGLDVSTASRRLTALERGLGLTLFHRGRGGLLPTDAALTLLPAAEEVERGVRHLLLRAGAWEAAAEGVIRISTAPGLADTFLVPVLAILRRRHPGLCFEVDASVRPVDLARGEADLALRSVRPSEGDLVVRRLLSARWVVAGAASLVRSASPVGAWADLPWITWASDLAHLHAARWFDRHVPDTLPVLRSSHFATQLAAAREGLGALLCPGPYLAPNGLQPLGWADALAPSVAEWPEDPLYLVAHRSRRDDPGVAAVWAAVVEHLRPAS